MTSGWMMPAAMPCKTRPRTIKLKSWLTPPMMLPTVKIAEASRNPPRWPNAATIHAFSSWLVTIAILNAEVISCAWSRPTPKAPITSGTATFTMVPETTMVKEAPMPAIMTRMR